MPLSETTSSSIQSDGWLTSIFGYDVFKLSAYPASGLPECARAFFYIRVPAQDIKQVSQLTSAGFRVIDMALTFERRPGATPTPAPEGVSIHRAHPDEEESILTIAETAFEYSRFHMDPQIPLLTANKIKREWVANTFAGKRGHSLYTAAINKQPAGFLSTLAADSEGKKIYVIDLIGVSKTYQGHGVGQALVDYFVQEAGRTYDLLRVGTQAANIPSCRLYEKVGFRLASAVYVLHAHMQNGKVA